MQTAPEQSSARDDEQQTGMARADAGGAGHRGDGGGDGLRLPGGREGEGVGEGWENLPPKEFHAARAEGKKWHEVVPELDLDALRGMAEEVLASDKGNEEVPSECFC